MAGNGVHPPKGHRQGARWNQHEDTMFTVQEVASLRLTCEGFSHKQAALLMGLSIETVRDHLKKARARWDAQGRPCNNVALLVRRCIEDGLVDPILPLADPLLPLAGPTP